MIPDLVSPGNNRIEPLPLSARNYRGPWLPGSTIYKYESNIGTVTIQESVNPLFVIGYRFFQFLKKIKLLVSEKNKGICLEAILTGEYNRSAENGKKIKIRGGQYFISGGTGSMTQFKRGINTSIFMIHYSQTLLEGLGFDDSLLTPDPLLLNKEMKDLIHDILNNPYEEKLRNFYYENTVREMLFLHLATPRGILPGDLSRDDIAKIYTADSIMLENLNTHFSIQALSKMAGTNEFKLKKGFRQVFGMGVFARLLHRRMVQAKQLLEATDKPIWEVGELAGYDSVAGFIKAFRKKFGMTPRQWRIQKDKSDTGEA